MISVETALAAPRVRGRPRTGRATGSPRKHGSCGQSSGRRDIVVHDSTMNGRPAVSRRGRALFVAVVGQALCRPRECPPLLQQIGESGARVASSQSTPRQIQFSRSAPTSVSLIQAVARRSFASRGRPCGSPYSHSPRIAVARFECRTDEPDRHRNGGRIEQYRFRRAEGRGDGCRSVRSISAALGLEGASR